MRVLFLVSHLNSGGTERTVSYLSKYFAERGIDTIVLSISDEKFYDLGDKVRYVSLHISRGEKSIVDKLYKVFKRSIIIPKTVKNEKPDVVLCMLPLNGRYVIRDAIRSKYKLITSERNNPEVVTDEKQKRVRDKVFKASNGIVFQTARALQFYPDYIQAKGIVIPNAIGNELAYSIKKPKKRRKTICAVGRLHKQKNYSLLIEAFKLVREKHPEYALEIYGDGPELNNLRELTIDLKLDTCVTFCGSKPDALVRIADAACYVLSSLYEGMPNALMEALAIGLPCVATDCPNGPAELIINGENGILVPNNNMDALANGILRMIEDREFSEMCSNNATRILSTHSINVNAEKYLSFIKKVTGEDE